MRSKILLTTLLCTAAFGAYAEDPLLARSLAATCANCHGTEGRGIGTVVAPLAGTSKEFIVTQMRLFREGKRPATIMHQLAKGYTEEQIQLIAGYLAAQPKK